LGDIGFMAAPQRVNVLLSRARDALIVIGNAATFMNSRKGKDVWVPLMEQLNRQGHVYNGFPVKCEQHPDRSALLTSSEAFDEVCPDGGCSEPWSAVLLSNPARHANMTLVAKCSIAKYISVRSDAINYKIIPK
jgi:hypothetical protein